MLFVNQESSTASYFEFPCKPMLGPSPELMKPQPSLRVVQGSIVRRQHMRGACGRWKWKVLGQRGLSGANFALAVPAPELMEPQPSLRSFTKALCGVSTWEEHTGGRKWEVLGWRGLSEAIFAPAVPAWHHTVHRTANCCDYGKL